jgi:hypothetical protein
LPLFLFARRQAPKEPKYTKFYFIVTRRANACQAIIGRALYLYSSSSDGPKEKDNFGQYDGFPRNVPLPIQLQLAGLCADLQYCVSRHKPTSSQHPGSTIAASTIGSYECPGGRRMPMFVRSETSKQPTGWIVPLMMPSTPTTVTS